MEFFNLKNAGDSAIVKILHTSIKTIEQKYIHSINIAGKNNKIKCNINDCPLCQDARFKEKYLYIYIHLFDYTDNKEKVWVRSNKILEDLQTIVNNWGNLCDCVLKITRDTDAYPKYSVQPVNPDKYKAIDVSKYIDQKVAYRFMKTRSNEELQEFINTGDLPEHKKNNDYVKKSEYTDNSFIQNSAESQQQFKNNIQPQFESITDDEDPFI